MKEKFYVFLDIEGTLGDVQYSMDQLALGHKEYLDILINPESVSALNHLLSSLETKFDVQLVVSSDYRKDMNYLELKLKEKGLKYSKSIDKTPFIPNNSQLRAKQILEYLKSKQNPYNIVIIDDSRYDLYEHFFPEHIIHIDNFRRSLDYKHVEQFINPYNLNSDNENSK